MAAHLEQAASLDQQRVGADKGAGLPVHRRETAPLAPPTVALVEKEPLPLYPVAPGDERMSAVTAHVMLSASADDILRKT
jgi:hypothetical protein